MSEDLTVQARSAPCWVRRRLLHVLEKTPMQQVGTLFHCK